MSTCFSLPLCLAPNCADGAVFFLGVFLPRMVANLQRSSCLSWSRTSFSSCPISRSHGTSLASASRPSGSTATNRSCRSRCRCTRIPLERRLRHARATKHRGACHATPSVCLSMISGRLGTRTACVVDVGGVRCRMKHSAFLCHVVRGRRSRCRNARGRSRALITYWLELRCYCAMLIVTVDVSIILPYNVRLRNVLVVVKARAAAAYYARRLWVTCLDGTFEGIGNRRRRR